MTVFSKAAQWLQDKRTAQALVNIVYVRSISDYPMQAQLGRTVYDSIDSYGTTIREESRDFLILVGEFDAIGVDDYPKVGDKIKETIGLVTYEYEVLPLFGSDQPYDQDMHRMRFRIHTKRISEE